MIELYDVEDSGEHPEKVTGLKEALEWEISLKKALMESQERLAKRVKTLESELEKVLEHYEHDSTCPTCRVAYQSFNIGI